MSKRLGKLNETQYDFGKLKKVIKQMSESYVVKVGIIGAEAQAKHRDTNLTNAELGAIHEFGATINVTKKMRGFFFKKYGIQKSKKPVVIPTRSFLRMPLLSKEGRQQIIKKVINSMGINSLFSGNKGTPKEFKGVYEKEIINTISPGTLATAIGAIALERVMEAFETEGFGQWQPTSEWSKQHRKYNPSNPTLTDTGDLRSSITFDVQKVS